MKKQLSATDWIIYNCHIHTFTIKNAPSKFWKYLLADSKTGKLNFIKALLALLYIPIHLAVMLLLSIALLFLLSEANWFYLSIFSLLLFLQLVLLIPILLVFVILLVLVFLVLTTLVQFLLEKLIALVNYFSSTPAPRQLVNLKNSIDNGKGRVMRSNPLISLLTNINRKSKNDIFERAARFLKIASNHSQKDVFDQIEVQYPQGKTAFVVLPMDMGFMNLGGLDQSIDRQHSELLELAKKSNGMIIPFYAADPRHPDIVERVKNNLALNKFRGIKIYPNLGYKPDDPNLMKIYDICIKGGYPVMTHCSPGGIWQYGLTAKQRMGFSNPNNYKCILDQEKYKNLKICLAHFGGAEEWTTHLKGRARLGTGQEEPWVNTIYDMIASGKYPNLYTDISYTVFTPKVKDLHIDLIDYLKVLLSNPRIKKRVLFGSDFYMVERESVSEKEVSVLLRSRLGEDLYKQIAYTNPRKFLALKSIRAKKKKTTKK